jgi:hypothetical protein
MRPTMVHELAEALDVDPGDLRREPPGRYWTSLLRAIFHL